MEPNRGSGSWLPQVETCPTRAKPCGNPADADEAMRAGQIKAAGNGNMLSRLSADQALKHALKIAKSCIIPNGQCPLEKYFGCDRSSALKELNNSVQ